MIKKFSILFLIFFVNFINVEAKDVLARARTKRQLLFPNSTILQFNAGVATHTPVVNRTILVNWAFQANFQLPWNRTQIPTDIFFAESGYIGDSRKDDHGNSEYNYNINDINNSNTKINNENIASKDNEGEDNNDKSEQVKNDLIIENVEDLKRDSLTNLNVKKDTDSNNQLNEKRKSREERSNDRNNNNYEESQKHALIYEDEVKIHHVYRYIEDFLSGLGHNGSACVLRAICRLTAEPLHSDCDDDVLHEISQFLLDPAEDLTPTEMSEEAAAYLAAQQLGASRSDCSTHFPGCNVELIDLFTNVYPGDTLT